MADQPTFDIPGLENIDMSRSDDTRPDWFDGPEMTEEDPAFKEIVAQMAEAGWAIPEALPEPNVLPTGKETDAAVDEAPDAELPPVYDDAPATDADAPVDETPAPGQIEVEIDGQIYSINQEQATYLLQMNSWIEQVPAEVKEQWAGIQDGTHVAITQEQLAAFQQSQQAPVAPQVSPNRPDIDDLDDDTAAYIRELEGRQQPVGPPPSEDRGPSQAELQAAANQQANERVRLNGVIGEVTKAYAEQYGLDEAQVQRLQQVTSELGVVPAIQRRHRVYSPTGQMIRDADFGTVVKEAYGVAMSTDPELSKAHADHVYQTRLAQETESNRAVAQKKGRAGSLASAPSAAVPAGDNTPKIGANNQMDMTGTANAIAAALTAASRTS